MPHTGVYAAQGGEFSVNEFQTKWIPSERTPQRDWSRTVQISASLRHALVMSVLLLAAVTYPECCHSSRSVARMGGKSCAMESGEKASLSLVSHGRSV